MDLGNIKVGDSLELHCYKHNGKIHRIWEQTELIEETDDYIVCGNYKTKVIESDGRSYYTPSGITSAVESLVFTMRIPFSSSLGSIC